ncbi:4Fe-4S ferredoxin iron-sulfur binding domain-containing protein [Desulfovibrio sp. X2]|uniref:4Fe-4S binding protein n=1 Tax=Desulfovibrio sp. X2 TaxID=941449 RepID=UPI000358C7D6|nr:4Fe-4S binding protein [Desulfovibrio sp. X2]EPR37563.1 4Fe-4S ferredoxin iron-sulfur binding domain-containing protein [Desulfovibrio sp. X2]
MKIETTPLLLRRLIQTVFLGLSVLVWVELYRFCLWAVGLGTPAARPSAQEAFLPISALLGLKRLVLTGRYDPVHPAGLTFLIAALLTAFLLRRGFCAFVCPLGLLSDLCSALGRKLGLERRVPRRLDKTLRGLKFIFLALCLSLFLLVGGSNMQGFMMSPFNITADAHLLLFFLSPSGTVLTVAAALAAVSLVARNAWCRWLCPYGALLGLAAVLGPTRVRREDDACTRCGRCERACPSAIRIREKAEMKGPECFGCAQCVGACPEKGAIALRAAGRPIPWRMAGAAVCVVLVGFCVVAALSGHWTTRLPAVMLKAFYARAFMGA